jgi:hypothetical protein
MSDFDKKLKHLEFIQNVITRMNSNSFLIKGWVVTLVAALFALSDKANDLNLYQIAFIPVPLFWILDGFFLATERHFVSLYKEVSVKNEDQIDFNMNPYFNLKLLVVSEGAKWYVKNKFRNKWISFCYQFEHWLYATFSFTLILFYGVLLGLMVILNGKFIT